MRTKGGSTTFVIRAPSINGISLITATSLVLIHVPLRQPSCWGSAFLCCERWASGGGRDDQGKLVEKAASSHPRGGGPTDQLNKRKTTLSRSGVPWPRAPEAALSVPSTRPLQQPLCSGERASDQDAPAASKFLESPMKWMSFLCCE